MSASALLDRLPRVKQLRANDYIAGCPAHGSRQGRPLHITTLDDGRTLLHPFCGCDVHAVLDAVGLTLSDLFPERPGGPRYSQGCAPTHSRISASDRLEIADHEIGVASLILADVLERQSVTEEEWKRLAQCAARVGRLRSHGR